MTAEAAPGGPPPAGRLPAGYLALDPRPVGTAAVVCRADAEGPVRAVLARWGTLYAYAAAHPARRELRGRAPVYAVPLGNAGPPVVVRHGWHGGALRRLRRDLFVPPTRASAELTTSERLRAAGVATPAVVAYAVYQAPFGLRRVDVATALVPDGADLAAVLGGEADPFGADAAWVRPTAALLAALARAGARHPDLNLKNVLLANGQAWVLDVDVARVAQAPVTQDVEVRTFVANARRLARSLRKWAAAQAGRAADAGRALDPHRALAAISEHARDELGLGRPVPLAFT